MLRDVVNIKDHGEVTKYIDELKVAKLTNKIRNTTTSKLIKTYFKKGGKKD